MESKKDIGKAFRDKLEAIQHPPPDAVWNRLQAELQNKKKRRVIPFWFTTAAVILVLLVTGGLLGLPYLTGDYEILPIYPDKNDIPNGTVTTENPADKSISPDIQTGNKSSNTINNNPKINTDDKNTTIVSGNPDVNTTYNNTPVVTNKETISKNRNTNNTVHDRRHNNKRISQTGVDNSYTSASEKNINKTAGNNDVANRANVTPVKNADNSRIVTASSDKNNTDNSIATNNAKNKRNKDNNAVVQNNTVKNTKSNIRISVATEPADTTEDSLECDINFTLDSETAEAEARIKDSLKIEARNARIAELREEESVNDTEETEDEDEEDYTAPALEPEKFYVFAHGGPAFYNLPDDKSNIDASLNNNSTEVKTSFNYGAYVGFILNDKFSLRVGFINTKLERTTNNATLQSYDTQNPAFPNGIMPPADYTGVEYRENTSNDAVLKTLGDDYTANIKLTQRAEFYEFPVEAVYNLYGSRAGINAVGGFSAFYLRNSTVTANNNKGSFDMGSLNGLKDLSISANLGLSLYYEIVPGLKINAEPLLKYHFSDFAGARLYNFNLQFGLQYTFNKNR